MNEKWLTGDSLSRSGRRLAIFAPSMAQGGAERGALKLAEGLTRRGFEVDLVLAAAEGPRLPEVSPDVRIVDLRARRVLTSLPRLIAYLRREEPLARVAADLGVSAMSLQRWLEQDEPVRFRPVEVEPGFAEVPTRGLVLITPRGYRVEGLEAGSLVSLLRVLE